MFMDGLFLKKNVLNIWWLEKKVFTLQRNRETIVLFGV